MTEDRIWDALLDLAVERGRGKSFCPSEVARRLDAEYWRDLMPKVRRVAAAMQARGILMATRRGASVAADAPGGPIRLALAPL